MVRDVSEWKTILAPLLFKIMREVGLSPPKAMKRMTLNNQNNTNEQPIARPHPCLPLFPLSGWRASFDITEGSFSRENLMHHMPVHVRQPAVAAVVAVDKPFVVDAEQVQDGGVDIVDVVA